MGQGLSHLAELYEAGVTMREIEREVDHTAKWVYRRLASVGILPNRVPRMERFIDVNDDPATKSIRQMRLDGKTVMQICKETGRDYDYIIRRVIDAPPRIKKADIPKPPKIKVEKPPKKHTRDYITPEELAQMIALRREGMPVKRIGDKVGRSHTTVRKHLVELGFFFPEERKPKWPRITTNMARALKGRCFEDHEKAASNTNVTAAIRNVMRFR